MAWSEENFALNKLKNPIAYQFIHADVKQYLKTLTPNQFDLVVMGSHGHGNIVNMVMGSVVNQVLGTCSVPVLIVR